MFGRVVTLLSRGDIAGVGTFTVVELPFEQLEEDDENDR